MFVSIAIDPVALDLDRRQLCPPEMSTAEASKT
jgi:hypothetical protein